MVVDGEIETENEGYDDGGVTEGCFETSFEETVETHRDECDADEGPVVDDGSGSDEEGEDNERYTREQFSLFRAVIFPDSPVVESNGSMYCYSFYNPDEPLFFLWIFLAFLVTFLFFVFLLFLNNCLGRKYRKKKNVLFD